MSELAPGLVARAHRAVDSLHSVVYFAPEGDEEYTAVGLRPGRMGYFASRSAPMGPVTPDVTTATFYNFNPELVARFIPRAWTLATVEDVLAARLRVADRTLRRLLGPAADGPDVAEAAGLARTATEALTPDGRPLYAGHAALPWPDEPHLQLWHALTLLREFRGDGHTAALLANGLSGLEALITHTVTGASFTVAAAKASRGWSDEQWAAGEAALRSRGLVDDSAIEAADGSTVGLTDTGAAIRVAIEADTDRLGAAPWQHLGPERTQRLRDLGAALTRAVLAAGAFPAELFARRG